MKLYLIDTYTVFTRNTQEKLHTVSTKSNRRTTLDYT